MSVSSISIRRPVGTLMLTASVVVLGSYFLRSLSVDLLPRITYPLVRIVIDWKGASPEEVEENIARKVEAGVATTEDAIRVVSSSIEGNTSIDVYFEFGKDMDVALADARAKLDLVRRDLPPDIEEPRIYKADPSQLPIMDLAIYSSAWDERRLRTWAENDLSNYFLGIPGLGAVVTSGGRVREIQVLFDQKQLARYEISTADVLRLLKDENIEHPAGRLTLGPKEYSVRLLAKFERPRAIDDVVVANREGRAIRLRQIARVADSYEDQRILTRLNGSPCVLMSFLKQPNANTVSVAEAIEKRARRLREKGVIPREVDYAVANSQAVYIRQSIRNVGTSAWLGALLTLGVIWLFLRHFQRTLVVGAAIPVSILGTFALMGLSKLTLNLFSLGGLVLAVGMLVDNAIVMLENITRHQRAGGKAMEGAEAASGEVASALVASTTTNVAAIMPFFLITGIAALLFKDLAVTVTSAFIVSLAVGLTLVPVLAARINDSSRVGTAGNADWMASLVRGYERCLGWALKRRIAVLAAAAGLFVAGLLSARGMGREFLPAIDDGKITVKVKLAPGTALEVTDRVTRDIEGLIRAMPGVKLTYAMVGGYWAKRNVYEKANEADIQIQLADRSRRSLSTTAFMRRLQQAVKQGKPVPGMVKVMRTPMRGIMAVSTSDIDLRLRGYDLRRLHEIASEVRRRIEGTPGLVNLDISVDFVRPELHVSLDRAAMSDRGLNARQVADNLRAAVDGTVSTRFTDKEVNFDYDIRLRMDPAQLPDKKALEGLLFHPAGRSGVPLREFAGVSVGEGPVQIDRENQVRLVEVTGDVLGTDPGTVLTTIKGRLAGLSLPAGYSLDFGGQEESSRDANRQLAVAVLLAVFLVFTVMAVQYESLLDPMVIMITLPLALVGSFFLLRLTHTPFGATAFLGLILLVGIVVNNAIVLVEYINLVRGERSLPPVDGVLAAAPTRLRPILMTSLTTTIGLAPLAFGWGEGLEMLRPLALAVMGGMASSTLLTLFVVPCAYAALHDWSDRR
ncbi:MAG TPA: AcrB/AcrD/AcrF family protein [Elusimicrobia bacterium]|nr:AcrB/AcrD/AcrF family protein [Elusimicrobiota bacterium]